DDAGLIKEWIPLIMEGRDPSEKVAATRMQTGTDVDYGALSHILLDTLTGMDGFTIHYNHRVQDLHREGADWHLKIRNETSDHHHTINAPFVFIGAGGGS